MKQAVVPVRYRITPARPEAHLYHVQCIIANPAKQGQRVWLPAWIPGSYMIRDFARNIITLHASANGKPIACHKIDKQTWQCDPCDGELQIDYEVYAWDLSVRAAHLDTTHAYFNGTSVFLAVTGFEQQPCEVEITRPPGEHYQSWRVATALPRKTAAQNEFGLYQAANYDELIDHPVEIGCFTYQEFDVAGTTHAIAITGRHQADMERLCRDVKAICETHMRMFGDLPPMERYVFQLTVIDNGFGGLEHRHSTSLLASRKSLPTKNMTQASEDYINLLGLFSHEYFHTWNVKQIKPAEFLPYNLKQEVHTEQLWAFEGITSYYDDLGMVRSGVITPEKYLEILGKNITRVIREPGRLKQTLPESSFDAWTKYYKQDENSPNAIVSYYVKGSLFSLALDLLIRRETQQQKSLDDVMRVLWREHGKPQRGIANDTIQSIARELAGESVDHFFATYLYATQDLPLQELFTTVGIDFFLRPATSDDDAGGKEVDKKDYLKFSLGGKFGNDSTGVRVIHAYDNGALQRAGLSAGDIIMAMNGIRVSRDSLRSALAANNAGDVIRVHAFRRDELMEFNITLDIPVMETCYLKWQADTESKRKNWISQS